MKQADSANTTSVSRRRFVAGAAGVVGTAAVASPALAETEIAALYREFQSLWDAFETASKACSDAYDNLPWPQLPAEICLKSLPEDFANALHVVSAHRRNYLGYETDHDGNRTPVWVTSCGWAAALELNLTDDKYLACFRGREKAWLAERLEIAQAYEIARERMHYDHQYRSLSAASDAAFSAVDRLEDQILAVKPTCLADLKIQAKVASHEGSTDAHFEMTPKVGSLLAQHILSLEG